MRRGRFDTDDVGYQALLTDVAAWPQRVWAVEGCGGVGEHLSQRLVAAGERVVDVPAKLSAGIRVFSTGHGRRTDATDARSVALVALRTEGLNRVVGDHRTVAPRLLVDRRDEPGRARTDTVDRLHKLVAEPIPGGAKKFLPTAQARDLLAGHRTRQAGSQDEDRGQAARRDRHPVARSVRHRAFRRRATSRRCRRRRRFPNRGRFATWNGTAPIDASSGDHHRHRLSSAGNRRINRVLWPSSNSATTFQGGPTTDANSLRASHPRKRSAA
ncbi:transposase [Actinosynnema sp. NPDC020468]|uniref:transposase n=1 Tax=Actinosynnema sp. NPDC020468 TaxID=3154488 RepID=UPI0033C52057